MPARNNNEKVRRCRNDEIKGNHATRLHGWCHNRSKTMNRTWKRKSGKIHFLFFIISSKRWMVCDGSLCDISDDCNRRVLWSVNGNNWRIDCYCQYVLSLNNEPDFIWKRGIGRKWVNKLHICFTWFPFLSTPMTASGSSCLSYHHPFHSLVHLPFLKNCWIMCENQFQSLTTVFLLFCSLFCWFFFEQ